MKFVAKARNLEKLLMASDGRAAMLQFKQQDGSTVGLEVERSTLPNLLDALMAFAKADGERHPPAQPLPNTAPNEALLLPCEEFATQAAPEGMWLKLRVGSLDLAVAFPGKDAARALAQSLLRETK